MTDQPGLEEAIDEMMREYDFNNATSIPLLAKIAYPIIERAVRKKVADAIEDASVRLHKNFPYNQPFLSADYMAGMDEAARIARGDSSDQD